LKNTLITLLAVSFIFSVNGQQLLTLIGTERLESRRADGLVGPVRAVLTVEKRDAGDYVETLRTATDTYDQNGEALETLVHYADIELHKQQIVAIDHSSIYDYSPNGQLAKIIHYDPDGSMGGRIEYRYDSAGRLIERKTYVVAKELFHRGVISYPSQWESLEKTESYDGGRVIPGNQWLSTFNNKGQLIENLTLKPDGSPDQKVIYSYDDKGNVKADLFSYKFDRQGNWVERKDVRVLPGKESKPNDKAWMMTYRVITYFGQN
jgi:YD repeat-containing protein